MYGLPQSELLAQEFLVERVGKSGYYQSEYTPGIWLRKIRYIAFSLCVENSVVKYVKEEDNNQLLDSLNKHYKVTVDDDGTRYLGITLERYYKNKRVHLSMPGYAPKALKRFGHEPPPKL